MTLKSLIKCINDDIAESNAELLGDTYDDKAKQFKELIELAKQDSSIDTISKLSELVHSMFRDCPLTRILVNRYTSDKQILIYRNINTNLFIMMHHLINLEDLHHPMSPPSRRRGGPAAPSGAKPDQNATVEILNEFVYLVSFLRVLCNEGITLLPEGLFLDAGAIYAGIDLRRFTIRGPNQNELLNYNQIIKHLAEKCVVPMREMVSIIMQDIFKNVIFKARRFKWKNIRFVIHSKEHTFDDKEYLIERSGILDRTIIHTPSIMNKIDGFLYGDIQDFINSYAGISPAFAKGSDPLGFHRIVQDAAEQHKKFAEESGAQIKGYIDVIVVGAEDEYGNDVTAKEIYLKIGKEFHPDLKAALEHLNLKVALQDASSGSQLS